MMQIMINLPCKFDTKFVPNLNLLGPVKKELRVKEVFYYVIGGKWTNLLPTNMAATDNINV